MCECSPFGPVMHMCCLLVECRACGSCHGAQVGPEELAIAASTS